MADVWCALLEAGAPSRVTGLAAAYLHGFITQPPDVIDLLLPSDRRCRKPPPGTRVIRTTAWKLSQGQTVQGVPVVSAMWALTDLGRATASEEDHALAVATAVRRRKANLDQLVAFNERRGRYPACWRTRRVLKALKGELTHSKPEAKVRHHARALGLRPHPEPLAVTDPSGTLIAEIDIAFPDRKLAVEIDGPHHWLPEQARKDRIRDRRLQALGWTVIRFSVYEVDRDGAAVAREIASVLMRQAA